MYYNKKMFQAAHLAYPSPNWNWNQFLTDARKLTINKDGRTVQWGLSIDQWWPKYGSFVHEAGGHILNANETQSLLNTGPVRKALIFYKQWMYKYDVTPTPNDWANLGAGITADALFGEGKAALMPTRFWDIATFNKDHLDYGITTMPMNVKGGTTAVGTGLAVVSKTRYPQVAFDAIEYMTSAAGEMPIVTNKEDIPANAQAEFAYYNQTLKGLVTPQAWKMMKSEVFSPKVPPTWNQWQTLIGDALGEYFDNKLSYQKMATEVDQQSVNTLAGVQ
jgi:multiple sugar transport system substrate-binding protein